LSELHMRNKWRFPSKNVEERDLVVVREDNLSPKEWRLVRVQRFYLGNDGKAQVVDLTTSR